MGEWRPNRNTSDGLVRKCYYVYSAEADRLRRLGLELERFESDLMREGLSELLELLQVEG